MKNNYLNIGKYQQKKEDFGAKNNDDLIINII
jgi:hypothetical protein